MPKPIQRELTIFLVVGLLTVGIDFLSYRGFLHAQPFGIQSINIERDLDLLLGRFLPILLIVFGHSNNKQRVLGVYGVLR